MKYTLKDSLKHQIQPFKLCWNKIHKATDNITKNTFINSYQVVWFFIRKQDIEDIQKMIDKRLPWITLIICHVVQPVYSFQVLLPLRHFTNATQFKINSTFLFSLEHFQNSLNLGNAKLTIKILLIHLHYNGHFMKITIIHYSLPSFFPVSWFSCTTTMFFDFGFAGIRKGFKNSFGLGFFLW